MDIAPLGLMVEEVTEIAVPEARAAMSIYAWGLGALPAPFLGCTQLPMADRTGSLFTLTLERELEGCGRRRSALRILAVPGGPEPLSPLLGTLATGHAPASAGSLPWIVERLLEGNSLTFLLLCVTLPDTSGEEILAALALAERVKGLAKTVSPTHWDPEQEAAVRRAEIRGLRAELLAGASRLEQERAVARLRRALWELQVLKSQRWEKKQMATKAFRANQMHQPGAKDLGPAGNPALGKQLGTQEPPDRASLEQGGEASAAESCGRGKTQAPGNAGQGLPEEPSPGKAPWAPSGAGMARSQCQPCLSQPCLSLEVQFSLAKARRQRLQAQHHLLLQQELGELGDEAVPGQEWDTARWQREVAVLGRSLETARRECEAAEQDLEALLHSHRQEMEAWRQHTLQVFQAQQRLAEEQAEELDHRYRALLQEVLRDAVELSAQNQQLRAARQRGSADATTQTS
ncbi:uncharacterized protein LOC112986285 [Dromaius novaehollandiae]|uniref:uncharacterized protein LOC112986285 n=1 Tax=Dromaius novaehollandiae TaxID=8790 RepID=UPI00311E861F